MLQTIKSFDHSTCLEQQVMRPDKYSKLFELFNQHEKFIVKGAGLSYSPAMFSKGVVVDFNLFSRILEFNLSLIHI